MLYEGAVMPKRTGQTWNHSVHWGQIIYKNIKIDQLFTFFTETMMHFVYPPTPAPPSPPQKKQLHSHFLRFLLGRLSYPGEIWKQC